MVYVYGIGRAGKSVRHADGVLGAPVETIEHGAIAAVASPVSSSSLRAKRRDLLRHSDVLQAAFADDVVLPFRFGTVFPAENALIEELLAPRHDEFVDLLDRFNDTGELRLRATYHSHEAILREVVSGNPQLGRLRDAGDQLQLGEAVAKAFAARRAADADGIVARLTQHAVDVRVDKTADELDVVRASFLVRRRDTAKFDELLQSVALTHRHLITFTCTGPVPPHSFVDLDGA